LGKNHLRPTAHRQSVRPQFGLQIDWFETIVFKPTGAMHCSKQSRAQQTLVMEVISVDLCDKTLRYFFEHNTSIRALSYEHASGSICIASFKLTGLVLFFLATLNTQVVVRVTRFTSLPALLERWILNIYRAASTSIYVHPGARRALIDVF